MHRKSMTSFLGLGLVAAVVGLNNHATAGADDCLAWAAPTPLPGSINSSSKLKAVYDSLRGAVVVNDMSGNTFQLINGTWSQSPSPGLQIGWTFVDYPSMAYDNISGKTLMLSLNTKLWSFDGFSWTQLPDPPFNLRFNGAMTFDSVRGRFVFFGGVVGAAQYSDETWEFDGQNWTLVPTPTRPSGREYHAMSFDKDRGVVVLFGGRTGSPSVVLNDTWEYNGSTWINKTNTAFPLPVPRTRHELVYHDDLHLTLLHAGQIPGGSINDTWVWDGTRWSIRFPTGSINNSTTHALVYVPGNQQVQRFGAGLHHNLNSSAAAPLISAQPQNAVVSAGQPVQFAVTAQSNVPLAYQWRFNGTAIPGATLSAYAISAVTPTNMGLYDCLVRNGEYGDMQCGSATTIAATLTVNSTCPGDTAPITGNGIVNVDDLLAVISAWGACP